MINVGSRVSIFTTKVSIPHTNVLARSGPLPVLSSIEPVKLDIYLITIQFLMRLCHQHVRSITCSSGDKLSSLTNALFDFSSESVPFTIAAYRKQYSLSECPSDNCSKVTDDGVAPSSFLDTILTFFAGNHLMSESYNFQSVRSSDAS